MTNKTIVILIFLTFSSFGCEKMFIGPQPKFIDDNFHVDQLNILGIIRPDTLGLMPQSFIYIEKSHSILDSADSEDVEGVNVEVIEIQEGVVLRKTPFKYDYYDVDSLDKVYWNNTFFPSEKCKYKLTCTKEGMGVLQGETLMPGKPEIVGDNLKIDNNKLQFKIKCDTSAFLYEVFLYTNENMSSVRIVNQQRIESTDVEIGFEENDGTGLLYIYAYDKNLSDYLSTSISYKPNIYQPKYSTVKNGFGCFGSLNYLAIPVQLKLN